MSELYAFCYTAMAGGLSVEVGRTLGHYKLAWGCHAGAVRFCGMLSNCRSIRMSPKAGTSSAPLQESGALFDFAAVSDLPACRVRPPRHGGAAAGHWLSPPRELEVTQILSDIGVFCVLVSPASPAQPGQPRQPPATSWGSFCVLLANAGKCPN